jgi:HTH-like domain
VSAFIEEHRERFGVEPICSTLGVSASAYYERASARRSARNVEDQRLLSRIRELHEANYYAYGYRRLWKALLRAGEDVGRDRVKRLTRKHGIQGAKRRGRPWRTTRPDPKALRPPELVERDFSASRPDEKWFADFTYLRCWEGLVFFSFVIDACKRQRSFCGQKISAQKLFKAQNGLTQEGSVPIEVIGCANAIEVRERKIKGRTLTLTLTVPGAGKLSARGKGLSKASRKAATSETITPLPDWCLEPSSSVGVFAT